MSPASPRQKGQKQKLDLLPSNALASERALSLAAEFGDDLLPEDIKTLWRPEHAASRFLSFLAWGLHLDFWRDFWPEELKRQLIAGSFGWHRKKGTVWAVRKVLEDLGFVPTIAEWFHPTMNTRAHTFSVTGYYADDPAHIDFLGSDTEAQLIQAVEVAKPLRSHLIFLIVAPPPIDLGDHVCRWDFCTWEHGTAAPYSFMDLTPLDGAFGEKAELGISVTRIFTASYRRFPVWEVELWEYGLYSGVADQLQTSISRWFFASIEWSPETPPKARWRGLRSWRGGTWRRGPDTTMAAAFFYREVE